MEKNIKSNIIATFSIVGRDPNTSELGVAVQSKFLGVGAVVPWAKAGVGAIATQAFANPAYGPDGLSLLEKGLDADQVIQRLTSGDSQAADRQVGVIDANGHTATYTGDQCYDWAGGITGNNFAAQGNILVNEETVTHMGKAFEDTEGPLADRLIAGLEAAQAAGGDSRGKQSAAVYVVKDKGGYGGLSDVFVDLRVDDHPQPIQELKRIYQLQQLYFGETSPDNVRLIEGTLKKDLITRLQQLEYISSSRISDEELYEAFKTFLHTENFEGREQEQGYIDLEVYDFIKNKGVLKNV